MAARERRVPSADSGRSCERCPRSDVVASPSELPRDLTRTALGESSELLAENVREHEAILAAIERRDATEARELMVRHVRHAGALITLRFEQRS